jgi:hypothetical protein
VSDINIVTKLLRDLLDKNNVKIDVDSNNLIVNLNGSVNSLPLSNTQVTRSSIGGFR